MALLPTLPADASYSASNVIIPKTEVSLIVAGDDLSAYYQGYDLGCSRGQQTTGSIQLRDRDGLLATRLSQFDQSHDAIRSHDQTDDRTIQLVVKQGEVTTDYPVLLPGVPAWDNEGGLSWAVSDMTPLLNLDNQSATDVLWDEGGPDDGKTVSDIVAVLAAKAGIDIDHLGTDWAVRTWRMTQENLLSKLDDLCKPTQSYRYWDGDTLKLKPLNEGASAGFHFRDRFHIASLTGTLDDSGMRTYFKAFRLRSQAQTLAEPRQGHEVGRVVDISFEPADYVRITTKQDWGVVDAGVFYDSEGNELNNEDNPQTEFYTPDNGETKAARWTGNFTPQIGGPGVVYPYWWWVSAQGGLYNAADTMIEGFNIEKAVTAAEALFGRRPEYSNLATELIREPETFAAMMAALETEVLWSVRRFSLASPWLRSEREGAFFNVTHYQHRLAAVKMLIQGWRHAHSWEQGWANSWDLRAKLS